jgi:non-ribosomal peptide synthetase-like protein
MLAHALGAVLGVESVSVDADFFTDLHTDSLLMAAFCARLREQPGLPEIGIRDPYAFRCVAALAAHLDTLQPARPDTGTTPTASNASSVSGLRYFLCGLAQATYLLGWTASFGAGSAAGYDWVVDATGFAEVLRLVVSGLAICVGLCLGPVAAKWLLVGRQRRPRTVPLWSTAYLRLWAARTAIRISPLGYLTGSALQLNYLRLLGARVGTGAVYLSRHLPSCPDLVSIGAGAVISKDVHLAGYTVDRDGVHTGPVEIGERAYVGAGSSLDIDTVVGNNAQLGHASALLAGQRIPPGERWHGSPARRTDDVLRELADEDDQMPHGRSALTAQLGAVIAATLVAVGAETALARWLDPPSVTWNSYCSRATALIVVAYLLLLALRAAVAFVVPRTVGRRLLAGRVYPRRGLHWIAARLLAVAGNSHTLSGLLGDSSYVVGLARLLGYDIDGTDQTGSTFGLEFQHDAPHLVRFGARSMASDGLSMLNLEVTATRFRLRPSAIGTDCYLGNTIAIPPGVEVPANCLIGTKTMVPIEGLRAAGIGLLGSPAFEIPRTVARDTTFDDLKVPEVRRALISSKNRHNLVTMALTVGTQIGSGVLALLVLAAVTGLTDRPSPLRAAAALALVVPVEVAYAVAIERLSLGWHRLRPEFHSIYDRRFWRHERMWKLSAGWPLAALDGTALKPLLWRLLGVRVGRRLYDGGCSMPEKCLVTIGDNCFLGEQSTIQCHSLEDATFKSGETILGNGSVVADRVLIHYDVRLGEQSAVRCDAFVMKGERVPAGAEWVGNPAATAEKRDRAAR